MLGPTACVIDSLTSSLLLPSTSSSWRTSDGRYELCATSKNTVKIPTRKAMIDRNARLRNPVAKAIGTDASRAARATSATRRIRRRRRRSTHVPASRPNTSAGADAAAPRTPIPIGPASRVSTAVNGIARPLTSVPNVDTVYATHSRRNPG